MLVLPSEWVQEWIRMYSLLFFSIYNFLYFIFLKWILTNTRDFKYESFSSHSPATKKKQNKQKNSKIISK